MILLDEKREYEVRRDDVMKSMSLAEWRAEAIDEEAKAKRPPALLADAMLPATRVVRRSQGRLEQRIALMCTVEAVRHFAAEHDGRLPERLGEIALPLPDDPFTGKPFRYERAGATAQPSGHPAAWRREGRFLQRPLRADRAEVTASPRGRGPPMNIRPCRARLPTGRALDRRIRFRESLMMSYPILIAAILAAGPTTPGADESAVRLYVRPAPSPRPALKYQLLPDVAELRPGNPAQNYRQVLHGAAEPLLQQRGDLGARPVPDDPARRAAAGRDGRGLWRRCAATGGLGRAARCARLAGARSAQEGGLETLPAEVGPLQILGEALQARFRIQVSRWRHDDATHAAATMFALARHLGEHPSEVGNLVGLWTAHLGLDTLEEMVQQPGCPNLYWALTDLPCPLVDVRKGVQGERALVAAELRGIRDDSPMTAEEIDAFVGRISGLLSYSRERTGRPPRSPRIRFEARVKDEARVLAARARLVEAGLGRLKVSLYPATQVILVNEKREFEARRDDRIKLLGLPIVDLDRAAGAEGPASDGDNLFADLLPRIAVLRRTQARIEQQVALLRHVEAASAPRGRARRPAAGEAHRDLRAPAARPGHRQAVPVRGRTGRPPTCAAGRWATSHRPPNPPSIMW